MKTLTLLLAAAGLVGAAFAQTSTPPPAPSPEVQKLAVWYGEWTYEGSTQTTPLGPGVKFTGTMSGRPILGGNTAEFVMREKSAAGETEALELCWYDPAAKGYAYVYLGNDGYIEQGPFAFNGEVCTWEARCVAGGVAYLMRGKETVTPDKQALVRTAEISLDGGKTWLAFFANKLTKVKATAAAKPVAPSNAAMTLQAS